jgi:hypothetical protein
VNEEKDTLFVRNPKRFVIPGHSSNGEQPVPDLVFEQDQSVPGLYRAKIDKATFATGNTGRTTIKQPKDK